MDRNFRQKLQLIINLALTVFTLFALIISVVAWFSTRHYAEINSIDLIVERKTINLLECPKSLVFRCATKINDVTPSDFTDWCVIETTYVVEGEGKLGVEIDNNEGILGYVWDDEVDNGDYYDVITKAIADYMQKENLTEYSYSDLKDALNIINRRAVGTTDEDGNTVIKILFWADYNALGESLNEIKDGVYEYNKIVTDVNVTFVS